MASTAPSPSSLDCLIPDVFSHLAKYLNLADLGRLFDIQNRAVQRSLLWPGVLPNVLISPPQPGGALDIPSGLLSRLHSLQTLRIYQYTQRIFSFGFDVTNSDRQAIYSPTVLEKIHGTNLKELEIVAYMTRTFPVSKKQWKSCRTLFPALERLFITEPTGNSPPCDIPFWRNFLSELPRTLKSLTLDVRRWNFDLSVLPPYLTYLHIMDFSGSSASYFNDFEPKFGFLDDLMIKIPTLQKVSLLSSWNSHIFYDMHIPPSLTDLEISLPLSTPDQPMKGGDGLTRLSVRATNQCQIPGTLRIPPSVTDLTIGCGASNGRIWIDNSCLVSFSGLSSFHFESNGVPWPNALIDLNSHCPNLTNLSLIDCAIQKLSHIPAQLNRLFIQDKAAQAPIIWADTYQLPMALTILHLETISTFSPQHIRLVPPGLTWLCVTPNSPWSERNLMRLVEHAPQLKVLDFRQVAYFSERGELSEIFMSATHFTVCDHIARITRRRASNNAMELIGVKWQLCSPPDMQHMAKDLITDGLCLPNTLTYLNLQGNGLPCGWTFKMTIPHLMLQLGRLTSLTTLIIAFPIESTNSINVGLILDYCPFLERLEIKYAKTTNLHLIALPRSLTILKLYEHDTIVQLEVTNPPKWLGPSTPNSPYAEVEKINFYASFNRDPDLALCLDYMPINMKVFIVPNAHFLSTTIRQWPQDMEEVSIRMAEPEWTPMQKLLFADNFTKSCNLNLPVEDD